MSYRLIFHRDALREWRKLNSNTREQFEKKLKERLENPRIPSARLRHSTDRYKIKLRGLGYRLVYEVRDDAVTVIVIAVSKRDRSTVYRLADGR